MINPASIGKLKEAITTLVATEQEALASLCSEIRPLKNAIQRIQPRSATSVSLVGTDGGNQFLRFDPFLIQLVRVVDSSNNEYCLEIISSNSSIKELDKKQFNHDGSPRTLLGEMMACLGVDSLTKISSMIKVNKDGKVSSESWAQVYRELNEWATLFALLKKDFGSDTLIVFDGLLRSKVFAQDLFQLLLQKIGERIAKHQKKQRYIYIVGVAKHSKVIARYRLAMALERILQTNYPAYVEVPREIEEKAYTWPEFARGSEEASSGGEINKFVGGKLFLVKFGSSPHDPIWPIDIFEPQKGEAQKILGLLLADAINGFPVPYFPLCL